jgi:hypothetical protein
VKTIITTIKLVAGNHVVGAHSSSTYGSEEATIAAAREHRDRYNASELVASGGTPATLVRSRRYSTARPL